MRNSKRKPDQISILDFQSLFEFAPDLFLVLKPDFTIVAVSEAYLKATMITREGILGKGLFEVFPDNPDDLKATGTRNLRASLNRVIQKLTPDSMALQKYDIRRPPSEGGGFEERFWSPLNSPVLDGKGKLAYIIHRVEDVTEFVRLKQKGEEQQKLEETLRNRAEKMETEIFLRAQEIQEANRKLREANEELTAREKALQESRENFTNAVASIKDYAILTLDTLGRVLTWNKGTERIKGYKAPEIIGKHFSVFYTPEDIKDGRPEKLLEKAAQEGRVEDEGWRVRKDGSRFLADVVITSLKDEKGQLRGFVKVTRDVTEWKKTEEELRRLGILVENSRDMISWGSPAPESKTLYMNKSGLQMLGINSLAELQSLKPEALIFPQDMVNLKELEIKEGPEIERRGHWEGEIRLKHQKTGEAIPVHFSMVIVKDPQTGKPLGTASIGRDVTEIKKAQKELQEKTELLDSVLKNIRDGIVAADEKGQFLVFNPAAQKISGRTGDGAQYGQWSEQFGVFRPDRVTPFPDVENPLAKAVQGEETNDVELFLRNPGHPEGVLVAVSGRPLKDEKGNNRGGVAIFRDITQAKKDEEKIRESEMRFRSIIQAAPSAIIVADGEGHILTWNQEAVNIFGYQESEVLGKLLTTIMPERYRQAHQAGLNRVEATGQSKLVGKSVELEGLRKDGTEFPILLSLSSWKMGEKRFFGGIIRDITEQKRQEGLRVYTQALEVSNKEMQDFVFVVSHDLQEPLRKIQSFGEFLHEEFGPTLGDSGKEYVERMRSAANRMQTLINDLLSLTRVTTKAQPFVSIELSQVLKEVLSDLETRIQETKAKVEVGPLPTLEADPTQMRQLFQNLIGNALKFQKPGVTPEIKVSAETKGGGPHGQCRIQVKDNGIGFDNKYAEQIFKVFERLHGRDEYEGTGIGLAICRKVVERHGGTIQGEGVLEKGSTFTITLPLQQSRKGDKV